MEGLTRESVRPLLDLQRIDSALDRLRQRAAELPEQQALDERRTELSDSRLVLAEREAEHAVVNREQSRLDTEVAALEEKISHESNRLYSGDVSSPKELSSIQAEIDALRRRKSHVEDQLLDVMERQETANSALTQTSELAAKLELEVGDLGARRDSAAKEIAKEVAGREEERAALVPQLPEELLDLYDDLRAKKDGVAAAALEGGVCRGCNVALSPFALDAIKRSSDPIVRCENCRRLLVIT